jgi:hypothetical protein
MSANNFLPDGYEVPKAGGESKYTKLADGENRLRILSNPAIGFIYWTNEKTPVRIKTKPAGKPGDMQLTAPDGKPQEIKEFWAVKAFNYTTAQMEVWEISQAQIKNALGELSRDADWGHPKNYDLKIFRTGKGKETKYSITPVIPKPVSTEVKDAFKSTPINLDALFDGGEVFPAGSEKPAPPPPPAPVEHTDDIPF